MQQSPQPLTPPSFRKENFLVNTSGGLGIGNTGLFKSASAVSVGRDFSGSMTPIQHQRKISYQSHLFRSSGSGSSSRTELSNLIRVRNSQLGKSAPSLSPSSVCIFFTARHSYSFHLLSHSVHAIIFHITFIDPLSAGDKCSTITFHGSSRFDSVIIKSTIRWQF